MPKGGRLRYVPLTRRLAGALNSARHVRGKRVLCDRDGASITQKVVLVPTPTPSLSEHAKSAKIR